MMIENFIKCPGLGNLGVGMYVYPPYSICNFNLAHPLKRLSKEWDKKSLKQKELNSFSKISYNNVRLEITLKISDKIM